MSEIEVRALAREIRHLYWHIRTLRRGYQDAARRRYYRRIEKKKKRLLEAGVSKREVLDLLMCYPGVGTQSNPLLAIFDAATGYTLPVGVERAVNRTLQEIEKVRARQPNADIRLLISGFSRGGAAARHFMNLLEKRWTYEGREGARPRFYALVFDTVATGQQSALQLQVPVSADLFYHFVSMDERRTLFPPILDSSLDREPDRIVTVMVPGVHSDVGGSYIDPTPELVPSRSGDFRRR